MFEPKIVAFVCKWCAYAGADLAGTSRLEYPPNVVNIQVMCSSRVDPQHVLWAFEGGADGVLVAGCHPGDCHYEHGNYITRRRMAVLRALLQQVGIEPERLQVAWISAAEGRKFADTIQAMTEEIKKLGPMEKLNKGKVIGIGSEALQLGERVL